jgi:hypothetical protein
MTHLRQLSRACTEPVLRTDAIIPAVFWPYRPRQGYPSAPGWLVALLVLAVFAVLFLLLTALSSGA